MSEARDPFWEHATESDKAYYEAHFGGEWSWPRAIHGIGRAIVFWAAVVAIVYVAVRYG